MRYIGHAFTPKGSRLRVKVYKESVANASARGGVSREEWAAECAGVKANGTTRQNALDNLLTAYKAKNGYALEVHETPWHKR